MFAFIIILVGLLLYDFIYYVAIAALHCIPSLDSAIDIFFLAAESTFYDLFWWPKSLTLFSVSLLLTGIYKQYNRRIR